MLTNIEQLLRPNPAGIPEEMKRANRWLVFKGVPKTKRDGTVEKGRPLTQTGAHVAGWNQNNIGICLVGGLDDNFWPANNFTREQWRALKPLVAQLRPKTAGGKAKVVGHRDFPNVHKACPCFEAKAWAKDNGFG